VGFGYGRILFCASSKVYNLFLCKPEKEIFNLFLVSINSQSDPIYKFYEEKSEFIINIMRVN
jgi:hypothetical protein